jgi:hypothetical protein
MSRERMPDDAQVSEGAGAGYPSNTDCYVDEVRPDAGAVLDLLGAG